MTFKNAFLYSNEKRRPSQRIYPIRGSSTFEQERCQSVVPFLGTMGEAITRNLMKLTYG